MRKVSIQIFLLLVVLYTGVAYVIYQKFWVYTLENNRQKILEMDSMALAIRGYVDGELKPYATVLKKQNLLPNNFYTPKFFSHIYVTNHIFKNAMDLFRAKPNLSSIEYKSASDNPTNLNNQATPDELLLLTKFRENPNLTSIEKVIKTGHQTFLYYVRPGFPNTENCLHCHGRVEDAPEDVRRLYGTTHGYNESVGLIRGVFIYKLDLTPSIERMNGFYSQAAIIGGASFLILYFFILWIVRYFRRSQKMIEKQKEALFVLANEDALTGLYNRHKFMPDCEKALHSFKSHSCSELMAIMIDVDHFKQFNDQYGHDVGDLVLQQLARHLQKFVAPYDATVYRLGGEEFCILVSYALASEAEEILSALREQLSFRLDAVEAEITLSVGVAKAQYEDTPSTLLKKADLALYYVKEHGRHGFHVFEEDVSER